MQPPPVNGPGGPDVPEVPEDDGYQENEDVEELEEDTDIEDATEGSEDDEEESDDQDGEVLESNDDNDKENNEQEYEYDNPSSSDEREIEESKQEYEYDNPSSSDDRSDSDIDYNHQSSQFDPHEFDHHHTSNVNLNTQTGSVGTSLNNSSQDSTTSVDNDSENPSTPIDQPDFVDVEGDPEKQSGDGMEPDSDNYEHLSSQDGQFDHDGYVEGLEPNNYENNEQEYEYDNPSSSDNRPDPETQSGDGMEPDSGNYGHLTSSVENDSENLVCEDTSQIAVTGGEVEEHSIKAPGFEDSDAAINLSILDDYFSDLMLFKVPDEIAQALDERNISVQYFFDEHQGEDVNMDLFQISIEKFPLINGREMTAKELLNHVRKNLNNFIDTDIAEFESYSIAQDYYKWHSENPLGAVLYIDIQGPDNAAVVCSDYSIDGLSWRFSTVFTDRSGAHPVSGHREFGIEERPDGNFHFTIKGFDVFSTSSPIGSGIAYSKGKNLWGGLQNNVASFINKHGGIATKNMNFQTKTELGKIIHYRREKLKKVFSDSPVITGDTFLNSASQKKHK